MFQDIPFKRGEQFLRSVDRVWCGIVVQQADSLGHHMQFLPHYKLQQKVFRSKRDNG